LLHCSGGVVVVTGCAHPGIVEIVERAEVVSGGEVTAVLGGFHMLREDEDSINDTISRLKELGVLQAVPCHCSGELTIELFRAAYGPRFVGCTVGSVIVVDELAGRTGTDQQPPD
jgi:7,8-dihydropterin-6-yl-methyl-4-(beta-D-ribofuranosyl)aminobenzene 5'-phosphate synthase